MVKENDRALGLEDTSAAFPGRDPGTDFQRPIRADK